MWKLGRKKEKEETQEEASSEDEELGGKKTAKVGRKESAEKEETKKKKKNSDKAKEQDEEEGSDLTRKDRKERGKDGKNKNEKETTSERRARKREAQQEKALEKAAEEERQREQASMKDLTAKDLVLNIEKEDLESDQTVLAADQIAGYVSVPVYAEEGSIGVTNAQLLSGQKITGPIFERQSEHDNCRGRVLVPSGGSSRFGVIARGANRWKEEEFKESISTGNFHRVLYDLNDQGQRIEDKPAYENEDVAEYTPERLRSAVDHVEYVLEGIFMVGQGLLAGGSLFQLIVVMQLQDSATFLRVYGPLASGVRQLFFFLSVFSFVGVCDKISAEREQSVHWRAKSSKEQAQILTAGILFFFVMLFTLLTFPIVDEIDRIQLEFAASKFEGAPLGSFESSTFTRWRLYVGLRFAFAALGWLLVCQDTNRDLLRGRQRLVRVQEYEKDLALSKEELAHMQGLMLDEVNIPHLERIRKKVQTGLQEVLLQLKIRQGT